MKNGKHILLAGMATMLFQAPALLHASTAMLGVQTNGDIRGGSPDTSFDGTAGGGNYLAVVIDNSNTTANGTPTGAAKAYLRFQLPADFGTATAATFSISRTSSVSNYDLPFNVYGLNNGTPGETTWTEDSGTASDLTWNNAPGNDPMTTSGFVDATQVGSFTAIGSGNGGHAGDTYTISGASLVNFISADTNGLVTLMISQDPTQVTSSEDLFASSTNTTYGAPSLALTYTPVPEPVSLSLIGAAAPLLLRSRRQRR